MCVCVCVNERGERDGDLKRGESVCVVPHPFQMVVVSFEQQQSPGGDGGQWSNRPILPLSTRPAKMAPMGSQMGDVTKSGGMATATALPIATFFKRRFLVVYMCVG